MSLYLSFLKHRARQIHINSLMNLLTVEFVRFSLKRGNQATKRKRLLERSVKVVKRTVRSSDWYRIFLEDNGCRCNRLTCDNFHVRVPYLIKEQVFINNQLGNMFRSPGTMRLIMFSSGQTGKFSVGAVTRREYKRLAARTDLFLNLFFGIKKGEALVINASAMGVRAFTCQTCCDTGPRSDIVVTALKEASPLYAKTVVIADPYLVKQIAEEAANKGVDLKNRKIWFISGGEWLPETLRGYVHHLTGKSASAPENGFWAAIFGVTELGYPLFCETAQLAAQRGVLAQNRKSLSDTVKYKLGICTTPFLFHVLDQSVYVEQADDESGLPELVFTCTNSRRVIPMIRYKTGDAGELMEEYKQGIPDYPLPVVAFWGRKNNWLDTGTEKIVINDIRELLFADFELAFKVTGYFILYADPPGARLFVQLKKGEPPSETIFSRFSEHLSACYPSLKEISFKHYHWFHQQMELDFERKFNHLTEKQHG